MRFIRNNFKKDFISGKNPLYVTVKLRCTLWKSLETITALGTDRYGNVSFRWFTQRCHATHISYAMAKNYQRC